MSRQGEQESGQDSCGQDRGPWTMDRTHPFTPSQAVRSCRQPQQRRSLREGSGQAEHII